MSRNFVTTTDIFNNPNLPSVGAKGTCAIWINPAWNSGDGQVHRFWSFSQSSVASPPSFQKFSDNNIYAGTVGSPGDSRVIIPDTGLFVSGQWAHWVFTWDTLVGETLYRNGASVGTHGPYTLVTGSGLAVGNFFFGSLRAGANSKLAHFAYWNGTTLNTSQILALASGVSPLAIRPDSLVSYLPLDGVNNPEEDIVAGISGTVTGTGFGASEPPAITVQQYYQRLIDAMLTLQVIISGAISAWQGANNSAISASEAITAALVAYQRTNFVTLSISELMAAAIAAYQQVDNSAISLTQIMAAAIAAYQDFDAASVSISEIIIAALSAAQSPDFISISDQEIITAVISAYQQVNHVDIVANLVFPAVLSAWQRGDFGHISVWEIIDAVIAATQKPDFSDILTPLPPTIRGEAFVNVTTPYSADTSVSSPYSAIVSAV